MLGYGAWVYMLDASGWGAGLRYTDKSGWMQARCMCACTYDGRSCKYKRLGAQIIGKHITVLARMRTRLTCYVCL